MDKTKLAISDALMGIALKRTPKELHLYRPEVRSLLTPSDNLEKAVAKLLLSRHGDVADQPVRLLLANAVAGNLSRVDVNVACSLKLDQTAKYRPKVRTVISVIAGAQMSPAMKNGGLTPSVKKAVAEAVDYWIKK